MNKRMITVLSLSAFLFASCGSDDPSSAKGNEKSSSSVAVEECDEDDCDEELDEKSSSSAMDLSVDADYYVNAYESLPVCNDKKVGQTGYVSLNSKLYVCEDGEWVVNVQKPSRPNSSSSKDKFDLNPVITSSESSEITSSGSSSSGNSGNGQVGGNFGSSNVSYGTLVDERDGQTYKTTKIGSQVWMAENLKLNKRTKGCYDEDLINCEKFGRLYGRVDAKEVCPSGWHLPSKEEFDVLINTVKLNVDRIVTQKKVNAEPLDEGEDKWYNHLRDASWNGGFNTFGFSALPAGCSDCYGLCGESENKFERFSYLGGIDVFWSSSTDPIDFGDYFLFVSGTGAYIARSYTREEYDNIAGYSVRCIQGESGGE